MVVPKMYSLYYISLRQNSQVRDTIQYNKKVHAFMGKNPQDPLTVQTRYKRNRKSNPTKNKQ